MLKDTDHGGISRRSLLLGSAGAAAMLAGGAGAFDYELSQHPALRQRLFGSGSTPPIPRSTYTIHDGVFPSRAMKADIPWQVALPPRTATGTEGSVALVIVLPGAGGQAHELTTSIGLPGFATAAGVDVALACPGGGGETYYHPRADGTHSFAWVTDEFLPMVERRFDVGGSRESRATFGWSMGGFGALLIAAKRPDLVSAAVGSSPAVFPSYDAAITGHTGTFDSATDWQRWGLWTQLGDLDGMPVRIDCGDGDPFAATARQLLDRIPDAVGAIGHGCHQQSFFRKNAEAQLTFLRGHLHPEGV